MKVVSGFVGFDANWGVSGTIDGGEEVVERDFAKMGKELLGAGVPFFPKGAGATNVVFPEA